MTPAITGPDDPRRAAFETWLAGFAASYGLRPETLAPASLDDSSRRYLRIAGGHDDTVTRYIAMDARPPLQDTRHFVRLATLLLDAGLCAPQVLQADVEQGFVLLADLGDDDYLQALQQATPEQADQLMRTALQALVRLQQGVPAQALPAFDEARLARELALFPEWCVAREFGITWTDQEQAAWDRICRLLIDSALAQPVVAVHGDWMPRNLVVLQGNATQGPGVLAFQDAVAGPITYDLASLLRDACISWDEPQELDWAVRWWQQARRVGLPVEADFGEFWRQLEWMGLQRHLKVMGLFCRLKHRDGKPRDAEDLPRFLNYAGKVALRYGPLKPLLRLLAPMSGAQVASGFTF